MAGYNSSGGFGGSTHASDISNHLTDSIPQVTSPGAIEHLRAGGSVCGCDVALIERNVPEDLRGRLRFSRQWMRQTLWFVAELERDATR